jgi:pyruvate/2-oxoacid:ferredoxin oxidoreductase alpha subunit
MVAAALKKQNVDTPVYEKVMGLGGDEITTDHIKEAVNEIIKLSRRV